MKAFYAGSFDPFTIGHLYIARQALKMFGNLIIGIGFNESKKSESKLAEKIEHIRRMTQDLEGVTILGYEGLTAEAARFHGASVLVRGVRNSLDFVKEKELADINLTQFNIPTVMIPAPPALTFVSSSMVRELNHFGYDTSQYVTPIKFDD